VNLRKITFFFFSERVIRSTGNLFQFNSTSLNFNRTKGSQARPEIMKTIDVTDY
jgi:hypothetical protein